MKDYPEDSLGNRIKEYEAVSTEQYFLRNLPLYARLDGRAFHTFTRGFGSPYPVCTTPFFPNTESIDFSFQWLMQEVCKELVRQTNASIGYVQSDEISLCWTDVSKAPFDRRKFKLESVLASLCTGIFVEFVLNDNHKIPDHISRQSWGKIRNKTMQIIPSFDCRAFQVPSLMELANCLVWRENDAVKNSISGYAQRIFIKNELHGRNQDQRLEMLREIGCDWNDLSLETRRGTYFHRILIEHEKENGEKYVRSAVEECFKHKRLSKIENKVEYLFEGSDPVISEKSMNDSGIRGEN